MVNSNTFKPNNPGSASAAPQAGAGKNSPQSLPVQIAGTGDEARGQIILDTTRTCLDVLQQQGITEPGRISATIINAVADELEIRNAAILSRSRKMNIPATLEPFQLAEVLLTMHDIKKICCLEKSSDPDYDLLGIYQEDGPDMGTYSVSGYGIRSLCYKYVPEITRRGIDEVEAVLSAKCGRVFRTKAKNLVPVNNGIFDFDTKKLIPYSKDYVFLGKCHVDYVNSPISPAIHNPKDNTDWEVEEWVSGLSDDHGIVDLIWEIIGACIRPNVSWNKAAWLYSTQGSNGKGTLCALMRNLCGDGNHTAIQLSAFSRDFALEPLVKASAIINDENDTDVYIDKAATLKAVITGDVFQMNRKFKAPIAFQFKGFMVQCINGMPKVKDKSNSFYRRQLVVPFLKNFQGAERRYIKDEYLARKDVLEYILWRVLNMDYYELSEPEACQALLLEYKEANDPVRQFWSEMEEQFVWDLLPYDFIHSLYLKWMDECSPDSAPLGRNTFKSQLQDVVRTASDIWWVPPKEAEANGRMRDKYLNRKDMMDKPEMLIKQYKIQGWSDDTYHGGDEARKLIPSTTKKRFRGLMRFERALKDGWCDEAGEPLQKRTPPAPVIQGVLPAVKEKDSGPEPEI